MEEADWICLLLNAPILAAIAILVALYIYITAD